MTLLFPTKLTKVNDCISVLKMDDVVAYFKNGKIFFIHKEDDKIAFRFIVCQLFILRFAKQTEIRKVFGISKNSIIGWVKEYNNEGAKSFYKRQKEKRYILTKKEIKIIQIMFDKGISIDDFDFLKNIDINAIDDAIWEGYLKEPEEKLINIKVCRNVKNEVNLIVRPKPSTKRKKKKIHL